MMGVTAQYGMDKRMICTGVSQLCFPTDLSQKRVVCMCISCQFFRNVRDKYDNRMNVTNRESATSFFKRFPRSKRRDAN